MERAVIPLALGIALTEWGHLTPSNSLLILLLMALLLAAGFSYKLPRQVGRPWNKLLFSLLLVLFFFVAGVALHKSATPRCSLSAGRHTIMVRLDNAPQATERRYRVIAEIEQWKNDSLWQPAYGRLMVYLPQDTAIRQLKGGDLLEMNVSLREIDDVWLSPTLNYRTYLRRQGILLRCYSDSRHYIHIPQRPTNLRHKAQRVQQTFSKHLHTEYLSEKHQLTAAALLLGVRDGQLNEVRQQFSKAGLMHLLCVSGLHVGLIAFIIGFCCQPLGNHRWQRILRGILQLAGLWTYVFITGLAPSSTRAGIMFSFFVVANMMRRSHDNMNTLCAAAFLLLLCRPMLLFDIGFQLSFAAMIGIIALFPTLASLVQMNPVDRHSAIDMQTTPSRARLIAHSVGKQLWDLACLTLSAQMVTLPLVLYYFRVFPTYFLLAGIVVVPFAGLILLTALQVVLLAGWPAVDALVARLLNALLSVVDAITLRIGALPYSILTINHFTMPMLVLSYVAIGLFIKFMSDNYKQRLLRISKPSAFIL